MSSQVTYVTGTAEVKRRDYPEHLNQTKVSPYTEIKEPLYVDGNGKCNCCPYGYHIDLGFVNYCESMNNGGTLQNLRRIQRTKRKLRKSMEMMLQTQDFSNYTEVSTPPPDVVHSTEASRLMNLIEYEQSAANHVLESIDTTVDNRIRRTMTSTTHHYADCESDDQMYSQENQYYNRQNVRSSEDSIDTGDNIFARQTRVDSIGSLSTMSDMSTELSGHTQHSMHVTGMLVDSPPEQPVYQTFTSAQLAATIESHMPTEVVTKDDKILISRASLKAIREAVALSLKQMKDLEEQLKAIPILQVRISVLKEEKRLLTLQAQANAKKFNQYSSSASAMSNMSEFKLESNYEKMTSSPRSFSFHISPRSVSPTSSTSYLSHQDHDSHYSHEAPTRKVMTRSIGVGDGNAFDNSGVQIHEKELRTVIIGGAASVGKRNVGIECRVPTRDVGIMYSCDDEKPSTRTVGINVDTGTLLTSLSFKREELSSALRQVLHHSVRSIGINCNMKPAMISVGTSKSNQLTTVGCGDDRIDVEIKNPTIKKSIGISAYPTLSHRSSNTDYGWRIDSSTNTPIVDKRSKSTTTDRSRLSNSYTNTEQTSVRHEKLQTDQKIFMSMNQIKNTGSNTVGKSVQSIGSNTESKHLTEEHFDVDVSFYDQKETMEQEKTYDDEEKSEDYSETITKTSYFEQVPQVADRNIFKTTKFQTSSIPVSNRTSYSTEQYSTSIPQSSSSSSSSSSSTSRLQITDDSNALSTSPAGDETDYGESQVTVTRYTQQVPATTIIREYDLKRGIASSQNVEMLSTSFSDYSKPGIKTNPNPFDYGEEFSSHRLLKKRQPLHSEKEYDIRTWTGDKFEFKDDVENLGKLPDITDEDVEKAQGYMRYLKSDGKKDQNQSQTQTRIEDDGSVETTTTTTTITRQLGDANNYQNYMNEMETSTDSGFEARYSTTDEDGKFESLRSCLKRDRSLDRPSKRGITFADSVVGGTGNSSDSNSGSDSDSASYDEGSYDSRQGQIVYSCQDDQIVSSGFQMFDQNIRETYELSSELTQSCEVLASYLQDSTQVRTDQLKSAQSVIQTEWFKMINNKFVNAYEVEDYMSSFNEISSSLLKYIVNMADDNGNTAIHYAVSNAKFEVVSLLMDTEAVDIDKTNKAGYTPIMLAALTTNLTSEQRQVVCSLFSKGNINAKASQAGQTALMLAVSHGRTDMVSMLLDAGADINERDYDGSTALMCACEHGHTDIVKMLLSQPDCDANLRDNDGCTALEIAMEAGFKDIGVILYAHLNFAKPLSPGILRGRKTSN